MSIGTRLSLVHRLSEAPKVIGIVTRLRQLDALHQNSPVTAASTKNSDALASGWSIPLRPAARHSLSAWSASSPAGTPEPVTSQLIPMIGITTSEHFTVDEQPRDALSSADSTTNLAVPSPCASL